jgi:hypothetical protein
MGIFLPDGQCWIPLGRRSDMTLRDGAWSMTSPTGSRARLSTRVRNSKEGSGLAVRQQCYPGEI